jgi:hypothetical protein
VLLGTHTLPEVSIAIPAGVLPGPGYPLDGDTAAPALLSTLTVPFPFATHTCPAPSIATASGLLTPPPVYALGLTADPCHVYLLTPSAFATHTLPDASNASPSGLAIVPTPAPVNPPDPVIAFPIRSKVLRLSVLLPSHTVPAITVKLTSCVPAA